MEAECARGFEDQRIAFPMTRARNLSSPLRFCLGAVSGIDDHMRCTGGGREGEGGCGLLDSGIGVANIAYRSPGCR